MIKSTEPCRGEGCSSHYIQNKKYHLCSKCVFKKNHGSKEQGEVYNERSKQRFESKEEWSSKPEKRSPYHIKLKGPIQFVEIDSKVIKPNHDFLIEIDEVSKRNQILQDNIQEHDDEAERKFFEKEKLKSKRLLRDGNTANGRLYKVKKKQKSIKKLSPKQAEIEHKYKLVCIDMDYVEEKVCSGCLRYQGGDIKLSHSHIISRKECKEIGKPELIYERENIVYHCMDFGENEGCHRLWENPKRRHILEDYEKNLKVIKKFAPELLNKYKK